MWLLYDYYFLVCAYIVAKPYVQFSHNICTHKKVEIMQSPHLQHLITFSATLWVQNFVANRLCLTKLQ